MRFAVHLPRAAAAISRTTHSAARGRHGVSPRIEIHIHIDGRPMDGKLDSLDRGIRSTVEDLLRELLVVRIR